MLPKPVACDTSLLSYFVHGGIFHILQVLFAGRLYVPPTVAAEAGRTPVVWEAVAGALRDGWLLRAHLSPEELAAAVRVRQNYGLDDGEAEAVALAARRGMVLIGDERPGRAAATSLGVLVTGSMGVLYKAVETGALTVDEADTAISRMRSARQWLPVQRYQDVKAFVDANPLRADWLKNL